MTRTLLVAAAIVVAPVFATADIQMTFRDGAPKDTFRITNLSGCAIGPAEITLDMQDSAGKLIFDVTASGAGVEVFQPLEFIQGAEFLASLPQVSDGQKSLVFDIANLPQNAEIAFTIDVDDTIGAREITVNGSEMGGSTLSVQMASLSSEAVFDTSATAVVTTPACLS